MPTTKLTLSVERGLIEEGKKLAAKEGTSLSAMFSRLLRAVLAERRREARPGPLTRKATGLVKLPESKTDREILTEALADRYGHSR